MTFVVGNSLALNLTSPNEVVSNASTAPHLLDESGNRITDESGNEIVVS